VAQQQGLTPLQLGGPGIEIDLRLELHFTHLQGTHHLLEAVLVPAAQLGHQFQHHIAGLGRQIGPQVLRDDVGDLQIGQHGRHESFAAVISRKLRKVLLGAEPMVGSAIAQVGEVVRRPALQLLELLRGEAGIGGGEQCGDHGLNGEHHLFVPASRG
jgi:hypothetical protein